MPRHPRRSHSIEKDPMIPGAREIRAAECMPYPEIVSDGPAWRVRDSRERHDLPSDGVTDMKHRVLYAPFEPDGREVALHELAHVRWSPRELPEVEFPLAVLHAVEDARVNLGLAALGLGRRLEAERRALVGWLALRDAKEGRTADVLLRAVASVGTGLVDLVSAAAPSEPARAWVRHWTARVERQLEAARRSHRTTAAPFEAGLGTARELARELERRGLLGRVRADDLVCCMAMPGETDEEDDGPDDPFDLPDSGRDDGGEVGPGTLQVREVPLSLTRAPGARALGRRWRAHTKGTRLGPLHRWPLDGAIFRRRAPARGGTILLDASGSMALTRDDVDALVEAAGGAAVVAVYNGSGPRGELRVVARGRLRAARDRIVPRGGGNVVDLPALEWLARQRPPRVWVSDGHVTGRGDRTGPGLRRRCAQVARHARIRRVPSAEQAVEWLARRARTGHFGTSGFRKRDRDGT